MKKLIVYCGLPFLVFLLSTGMTTSPQDPPGTKKEVKVIVIKDGEKTVVDTVIYGRNAKAFQFRGEKGNRRMIIHEEGLEGDTGKQVRVFVRRFGPGEKDSLVSNPDWRNFRHRYTRPMAPLNFRSPTGPGAYPWRFQQMQTKHSINLDDPGIISYKKKKLSGGREKITVIRKEVKEVNKEEIQFMQFERNRKAGNDEELRKMNAPRRVRELDLNRKDLPKPSEITAPAEKK